jgi:hypothetical protein
MTLKPDGKAWTVPEQTFADRASGLTFEFAVAPDGTMRLRVYGDRLPFGNREFVFNDAGLEAGSGTFLGPCRPGPAAGAVGILREHPDSDAD